MWADEYNEIGLHTWFVLSKGQGSNTALITNANEGWLKSEGNEGGLFSRNENSSFQIYSSPTTAIASPNLVLPMVTPTPGMEREVASERGEDYSPGIGALHQLW